MQTAPDVIVAGAGMAGLAAAAQLRRLGARVLLLEKGDRPGGSMRLSSGVIWRHRAWEHFRAECPDGEPALQQLVFDRLDESLAWLEDLGAPVVAATTGNPRTTGTRFDPRALTAALVAAAGPPRLRSPLCSLPDGVPVILATGGFQADRELVRRHITPYADDLLLRATPWSSGDGLRLGLAAGGACSAGMDQFYGRCLPAPPATIAENEFVALAQLYADRAQIVNASGEPYVCRHWAEIDVVQWTARQPGARAQYSIGDEALEHHVHGRSVREMIDAARAAGGSVRRDGDRTCVAVAAAITTTLGGLRVDTSARVADGVFACGQDVGGIATGGYASGLAAALVLGRAAAHAALGRSWE